MEIYFSQSVFRSQGRERVHFKVLIGINQHDNSNISYGTPFNGSDHKWTEGRFSREKI